LIIESNVAAADTWANKAVLGAQKAQEKAFAVAFIKRFFESAN
jgi:hypothetical protein